MLMAPFIPLDNFSINDCFNLTIILSSPISDNSSVPYFEYLSYSVDIHTNQSLLASAVSAWS